ncbi:hypothetical protein Q4567_00230 [Aliiglaciecola sp. 2_MG-2023]|uniref:hypothetical protein n=1 Tax=unclassified Aliiglaciecola TaxID=2593648 RepID=UPI0026E48877|nr:MULTISPECIES: hypothetical protein [unclassified Aliiglaciecola]MDO6709134.1 hypothetical protein [Aliiglaciecola sp. 2_MG-2023]MDO6750282.1 hypothetical protein [Aliiglaciecola sp. 1_MG-2023]
MKQLILHVGLHKTGTSSIQSFLMKNIEILKEQGTAVYTRKGKAGVHWVPAMIKNKQPHQVKMVADFVRSELAKDDVNQVIISSENFTQTKQANYPMITSLLPSNTQLVIIIYLRRQDLLKQSVYSQMVKQGTFSGTINEDSHYNLDLYKQCTKWKALTNDIRVRVVERSQLIEGDLLKDFVHTIGLKWNEKFEPLINQINESYCSDTMEFKRLLNAKKLPPAINKKVAATLSQYDKERSDNEREKAVFFDYSEASSFLDGFHEGNSDIAREFLGREDGLLFTEMPSEEQLKNIPKLSEKQILNFSAYLIKNLVS